MRKTIDQLLEKLEPLIRGGEFEELESDGIEIKPVPATGGEWRSIHETVNAFLNTRGGVLLLGVKEEQSAGTSRYIFTGYRSEAEPKLKEFGAVFTDRQGRKLDLKSLFPNPELRSFMDGQVAVVFVDELPADQKFCFLNGVGYRRVLTGDHKLSEAEISSQEEYKEDVLQARELMPVANATPNDLDIDQLNEYIQLLNRQTKVETMKPDVHSAMSFLSRKAFVKDGQVTTLGMLVCGQHPEDHLQFRCRVHGYVEAPQVVVQDKQVISGNILPVMEAANAFVMRNIPVGVSLDEGGSATPQYPQALIRETVNNALAHRDYSIDKYVTITIKPGSHIEIRNPGAFRKHLVIEEPDHSVPVRRIVPEARPRNPKLAMVLMVFNKWEGKGIGMATMVDLCLQNLVDLPYYRFYSESDIGLFLNTGRLLDDRMEALFLSFDRYIEDRLEGRTLNEQQKRILAYLIKSEWANAQLRYTILLTPDNNHFNEISFLENKGLISKHQSSTSLHPVYIADRLLLKRDHIVELRDAYGAAFDQLHDFSKDLLSIVYRFNRYSKTPYPSARQVSLALWFQSHVAVGNIKKFDGFLRKARSAFNGMEKAGFIHRMEGKPRYCINDDYKAEHLL
ncbi:MAG: putative DNA binding domain-containing protein [Lentisphaerae bacterium]|nr:putative DNA binding domain-containing protein [Lentisphaerota bacterium]